MANAKKCDRCGAYYDLDPIEANPLARLAEISKRCAAAHSRDLEDLAVCIKGTVDLCPDCSKSLRRWLSNEQNA